MTERLGWLYLGGWHGNTRQPVVVVGETPARYRIRPDYSAEPTPIRLAGRNRSLRDGETALVPKHAVLSRCPVCKGRGVQPITHPCIACVGTGVVNP